MNRDEELALRLQIETLKSERNYTLYLLAQLLSNVTISDNVTSKTYKSRDRRTIKVPARPLATLYRMVQRCTNSPKD